MYIRAKIFVRATLILTALLVPQSVTYGQESKPSPAPPKPEPDFWTQEELTGDWGGTRSLWKEHGVELEFKFSQFLQGVAAGGIDTGAVGNGKFQTGFKFDLGKLAGWKFWSAEIKPKHVLAVPCWEEPGRSIP